MVDSSLMNVTTGQLNNMYYIAEVAGLEVMVAYTRDFSGFMKDDASPVTEADFRADGEILRGLEAHFPGIFIVSQESAFADFLTVADTYFLADPPDGTMGFLKRTL